MAAYPGCTLERLHQQSLPAMSARTTKGKSLAGDGRPDDGWKRCCASSPSSARAGLKRWRWIWAALAPRSMVEENRLRPGSPEAGSIARRRAEVERPHEMLWRRCPMRLRLYDSRTR